MDADSDRTWEVGWEGHERAQRERLARLPLAVRLEWLEEMQRVIERMKTSRDPHPDAPPR
jgi:hypothetical protein